MMPTGEEELLKLVQSKKYQPAGTDELAESLSVGGQQRAEFDALLEDVQRRGLLVRVKKQWVVPQAAGLVVGAAAVQPARLRLPRAGRP